MVSASFVFDVLLVVSAGNMHFNPIETIVAFLRRAYALPSGPRRISTPKTKAFVRCS